MSEDSFLEKDQESILIIKELDDIVDDFRGMDDKNLLFSLSFYNKNPNIKTDLSR